MKEKKKVLLAISGGIDSTVAAYLLKEEGYQITAIYFCLVDDKETANSEDKTSFQQSGRRRAETTANKLDIPLLVIDYREEFNKIVVDDFIKKYHKGLTPNPCILCNERIKFNLLEYYASKMKIDFIATGHYVRVQKDEKQDEYLLKRGIDKEKDQSYFLYRLNRNILSKCIFPLGNLKKSEVKAIAHEKGVDISNMRESQEICFIPENNYRKFIKNKTRQVIHNKPGYFIDAAGNILGKHKGIAFYTIGQRRKIGLSLNTRKYIIRIEPEKNIIVIGDEIDLYKSEFKVEDVHYISDSRIIECISLEVQIRYNTVASKARIHPDNYSNMNLKVIFDKPKRAITPGQSAVFYDREIVIGGGFISY